MPSHPLSENMVNSNKRHSFPENGKWVSFLFKKDKGRSSWQRVMSVAEESFLRRNNDIRRSRSIYKKII